jgi:hypothetical protein
VVVPLFKHALLLLAALALLAAPLHQAAATPQPATATMSMPCDGPDQGAAKGPPCGKDAALPCAVAACATTGPALLDTSALSLPAAVDGRYAPAAERIAVGLSLAPEPSPPKPSA